MMPLRANCSLRRCTKQNGKSSPKEMRKASPKHNFCYKPLSPMSKILITGASGFVGSFLVEKALELGFDTWAVLRKTSSKEYLTDPRIHFIELDLGNDAVLTQQLSEHAAEHGAFDYVIHAAGATKAPNEAAFRRTNTEGTLRLARTLLDLQLLNGRFVFVSSLSVVGAVAENPIRQADGTVAQGLDRYRAITDADTPQPNTAYGRSKLDAERALAALEGLDFVTLRPTGVYGPRERDYFLMADSIKKHIDFAVGYTPQALTFIYVRDLVDACFLALHRGERGRSYFLSDGEVYDSRAFSDLLQQEMGVKWVVHIKAPVWFLHAVCQVSTWISKCTGKMSTLNMDKFQLLRQRNWICDITPAQQDLGYAPQWTLSRGVPEAVAWYKAEGWI